MMLISRSRLAERELLFKTRIKELENILCPAEQHEYAVAGEEMHIIDGYGTVIYSRRYVCKRCLKAIERDEYV